MKLYQSTKEQNKQWAFIYIGIAFLMIAYAAWKDQFVFYIFAAVLVGLAGYNLYWLEKKLK